MPFVATFSTFENINTKISTSEGVNATFGEVTYSSKDTGSDYLLLSNKPRINSVELAGNKELDDIGVGTLTNVDIENLIKSCV